MAIAEQTYRFIGIAYRGIRDACDSSEANNRRVRRDNGTFACRLREETEFERFK
jgi:hypothetical protein